MIASVLHQSIQKIVSLATHQSTTLAPFFFIRNPQVNVPSYFNSINRINLKVNRQMTPMLNQLPSKPSLAFWSTAQFENSGKNNRILENSLIINPFKTEKLIRTSLTKGITKMLVSDIDEMVKIQQSYFNLLKEGQQVSQPKYIWSIEDAQEDLSNVLNLQKCELPISGFYFTEAVEIDQIKSFLKHQSLEKDSLEKYRQLKIKSLQKQAQYLNRNNFEAVITDYSELNDYIMICRIIGRDKNKNPVFEDSCLSFICKSGVCTCSSPSTNIINTFQAGGFQWAALKPSRLDLLQPQFIIQ